MGNKWTCKIRRLKLKYSFKLKSNQLTFARSMRVKCSGHSMIPWIMRWTILKIAKSSNKSARTRKRNNRFSIEQMQRKWSTCVKLIRKQMRRTSNRLTKKASQVRISKMRINYINKERIGVFMMIMIWSNKHKS